MCRFLRQQPAFATVPIILLCPDELRGKNHEIFHAGATDYILKPCLRKELLAKLFIHVESQLRLKELTNEIRQNKLLLDSAGDGIVGLDLNGQITFINHTASRLLGYMPSEIIGKNLHCLVHHTSIQGEAYGEHDCPIVKALAEGEIVSVEDDVFWRSDRSSLPVKYYSAPIINDDIVGAVVTFSDISAQKKIEAMYQEIEQNRISEQLRAMTQGKLASLGEIATGIAHEINQPLTFINTLMHTTIERLKKGPIDAAKLTAKFETAVHQAERITTIIDHLRTFGRADDKELRPVSLETILDNALILMQERIRLRNIVIVRNIAKNLPSIMGNSHTLEQIFINFFQNSTDAMQGQGGGKIMISMGHEQGSQDIWLSFADSGPGMTPEVQKKMFEPFFTTKDIGKGTGLGLSVVFGIVKDHHGEIVCRSEPGKGTTFVIALPLQPPKKETPDDEL